MLDFSRSSSGFSALDPFHASTVTLDAARQAYVGAPQVCDQAVRRGGVAALDAALQDAAERLATLHALSQLWLRQSAQRKLWSAQEFPARKAPGVSTQADPATSTDEGQTADPPGRTGESNRLGERAAA